MYTLWCDILVNLESRIKVSIEDAMRKSHDFGHSLNGAEYSITALLNEYELPRALNSDLNVTLDSFNEFKYFHNMFFRSEEYKDDEEIQNLLLENLANSLNLYSDNLEKLNVALVDYCNVDKTYVGSEEFDYSLFILNAISKQTKSAYSYLTGSSYGHNLSAPLGSIIKQMSLSLKDLIISKNITVEYNIENDLSINYNGNVSDLSPLMSLTRAIKNDDLVYDSLLNLLKNAVEASPENDVVQFSLNYNSDFEKVKFGIANHGTIDLSNPEDILNEGITVGKDDGNGYGTSNARSNMKSLDGDLKLNYRNVKGRDKVILLGHFDPQYSNQ